MRDFFRFSIRQFLLLVVCVAICIAVNRDKSLAQFLEYFTALLLAWFFLFLPIAMLMILIWL